MIKKIILICLLPLYLFGYNNEDILKKLEISNSMILSIPSDKNTVKILKSKSELGDADSSYLLGIISLKNTNYKSNKKIAFKYFYKSANNGNSEAQRIVGLMYYFGIGTKKNLSFAKTYMSISYSNDKNNKALNDWEKYKFHYIKN